jgi:N6-L-threonylcarbamoyladenine synthase
MDASRKPAPVLILGIETSCDETAAAVVEDGRRILSSVIASQTHLHRKYGGVVPEIACRAHIEAIVATVDEALARAAVTLDALHGVAVTNRPGLIGALLIGLTAAKSIAWARGLPLCTVNHIHGHIYASLLERPDLPRPFVALVASGGHTTLALCRSAHDIDLVGSTTDDAAGEAFDKVAKILDLGYPGGPAIDRLARCGDPGRFDLPRTYLEPGSLDFSFSGIKTAVLYTWQGQPGRRRALGDHAPACSPDAKHDLAASFQEAVVRVLVDKTLAAARRHRAGQVVVGGGVACNSRLRESLTEAAKPENISVHFPSPGLCTDNAAMIAGLGYHHLAAGRTAPLGVDAYSRA